MLRDIHQ